MARDLDIRISAARDHGFVVWENAVVIAAFDDPQQLAMWVETRAMMVEGEAEKLTEETSRTFPSIVKSEPKRGLFGRG